MKFSAPTLSKEEAACDRRDSFQLIGSHSIIFCDDCMLTPPTILNTFLLLAFD